MNVLCWNLKDIGGNKLTNTLSPFIAAAGLGGTVLDYITKVVMADAVWNNIITAPADVFVIIELASGGNNKGAPAGGNTTPTITTITQALNTAAAAQGLATTHHYTFVPPLLTGKCESVGVIYNDLLLTYVTSSVLRDTANRFLLPYTPFMAEFTTGTPAATLRIVGIHAPKPRGGQAVLFKDPIQFSEQLAEVSEINQALPADQVSLCLVGDFNCNPGSTYVKAPNTNKKQVVTAFASLQNTPLSYLTQLPTPTLTSCRQFVDSTQVAPANYLKAAYDNIFYKIAGVTPVTTQLDTIGNARDAANANAALYPVDVDELLAEYWSVSDHLPVLMTY